MSNRQVVMTAREKAELLDIPEPGPLGANEVRGETLATLISPGTELNYNYFGKDFPNTSGYSSVFTVEELGAEVKGIEKGDILLCMGNHRSYQQIDAKQVLKVPEKLIPEEACIARLMGVTMTTLKTTKAKPGDKVLVTGAGPVGYLCAHMFTTAGYDVSVIELNPERQAIAKASGIKKVFASFAEAESELKGKTALVVECSGHEQAVLDACKTVGQRGEVVLVGVPWKKRTDLAAFDLLHAVFHNYVYLRSGWEWELPLHSDDPLKQSIFGGLELAMKWLSEGKIPLKGLLSYNPPEKCGEVYASLAKAKAEGLFVGFRWK